MCPNVIHVCTADRRGDQMEGLVGAAPPPLFGTNNPAGLVVTELRKADRTVWVNCNIFSNISSGTA